MNFTRIVYKNDWREGTIIDYSTQEPQFPAIDTQRDTLDQQWRTENDTETAYVSNNLGAPAKEYNYVALLGHNIPVGATIKIIGADDAGFSSGVVEDTITHNAENIYFYLPASRTKQYVKIEITNPDNPDNYITIATIVVGKYYEFDRNHDWGEDAGDEDHSELEYSDALVAHAQEKDEIFAGSFFFAHLNDASAAQIRLMNKENKRVHALVVDFNHAAPNSNSYWVRLSSIVKPKPVFITIWSWTMKIIEAK